MTVTHKNTLKKKDKNKTPASSPWSEHRERQQLKAAWVDWVGSWGKWDTACSWHVPDGLRADRNGWDKAWLETRMNRYFKAVDRRVFKGTPLHGRANIKRYITLEYAEGAGWHAHGLVETPAHMAIEDFRELLAETWTSYLDQWTNPKFKKHLVYLEDIRGEYVGYSSKNALQLHETSAHLVHGEVDLNNSQPT